MTPTAHGFVAFGISVERTVFAPGFDLWQRSSDALRRVWRTVIGLPGRIELPGRDAPPDQVPPEFFRFPPF